MGLRANAETQTVRNPAGSAGSGERDNGSGARRRWAAVPVYLLAGAVLFVAYLRLSETYGLNSDSANVLLMGWDLLHGNLLLHGWYMSDVSFFPTELPQYALLESFLGLHMQTAHVAAAMTYTLVFLFAVLLARSGSDPKTGRAAWIRTLITAGIMLAPQFGLDVFALDLSVGHIGTSVPLLLTWLLLDKMPARWYVPVLTAVLLAWVLVADPIAYVVGVGPLGVVCAARVLHGLVKGTGRWTGRLAAVWFDLALGASTVAATVLAWAANNVLTAVGGYTVNRPPFYITPWQYMHNNVPAAWKVLQIFGANYAGLGGIWLALAFLHMASVLVVAWAVARVARRFFRVSLVDQVLAAAIVLNVVLYMLTNAANEAAHEVAVIVPFGAALAARVLVPARGAEPAPGRARWARLAAVVAGAAVLAGYTAGFGYELTQPRQPPANTGLASWLFDHHLTYGLSGYWTSSSVTVNGGQRVKVRALMQYTLKPDLWMAKADWYDPKLHSANFVILDSQPGNFSHWEPYQLVKRYFGTPAKIYHTGPYTIMVWNRNLLTALPDDDPPRAAPGQFDVGQLRPGGLRTGEPALRDHYQGGHRQRGQRREQPGPERPPRGGQQDDHGQQVHLDEGAHVRVQAAPGARRDDADLHQVEDERQPFVPRRAGGPQAEQGRDREEDEDGQFQEP